MIPVSQDPQTQNQVAGLLLMREARRLEQELAALEFEIEGRSHAEETGEGSPVKQELFDRREELRRQLGVG
jgi:hypothetical protein